MLSVVSEVFGDVAASQEILSDTLSHSFIEPLESLCSNQLLRTSQLQAQYKRDRNVYDDVLLKYLRHDSTVSSKGNAATTANLVEFRAYEVVIQRKQFETTRFELIKNINEVIHVQNFELGEICVAALLAMR